MKKMKDTEAKLDRRNFWGQDSNLRKALSSATRLPFEAKKHKSNCAKRIKTQGALPCNGIRSKVLVGRKRGGERKNNYISFYSFYDYPFT